MKVYRVKTVGGFSADRVVLANNYLSRLKGLMFRKSLGKGEGLLLENCGSIHCCFMNFPIDVVYLNEAKEVLKVETVRPWRIGSFVRGAKHVLEVGEGCAANICAGEKIEFKEVRETYER